MKIENIEEKIDEYINLDWTIVHGTDLDFDGNEYSYIEIKEFPSFAFCAKTKEIALANYKKQLRLTLRVMLEFEEEIPNPGDNDEEIDWESLCP
jgi:predicted RNase H-like HicB family nuclease